MTVSALAMAASQALGSDRTVIGDASAGEPRFELFHASNSICSQKVRAVLAHHGIAYVSHSMNLFTGDAYLPEYVRLRMAGCARHGGALVERHTGSTAASQGCDPVVVPTLVDLEANAVIVDSKAICHYLDRQVGAQRSLVPPFLAEAIEAELAVVDEFPNYQLLMGRMAARNRPGVEAEFSRRKVAWCDQRLAENAHDAVLVAAYSAKRAKELWAADHLFSASAMAIAQARLSAALKCLEERVAKCLEPFLFGEEPTLADLFWGIELLRVENLGHPLSSPNVSEYALTTSALPALRKAVLEWPGALY